jgi:hypothetical protein
MVALAIIIIAGKIGYECGRYHRSPRDMWEAAKTRIVYMVQSDDSNEWEPLIEPTPFKDHQ